MKGKLKILFLCTGNSCRSQMAEGWTHHLKSKTIEPYSAGIIANGLNPHAVTVMKETGIDISLYSSKIVESLIDIPFDQVITVCNLAKESCPVFPKKIKITHVSFDDPPSLAKSAKSEEEALSHFRRVRDQIRAFIEKLPLE
ncbi:MAG: arsenate reductase ArsC [Nitrospina sp.]|nr:arsenate reductase ArsC [Nitrospina sp.]